MRDPSSLSFDEVCSYGLCMKESVSALISHNTKLWSDLQSKFGRRIDTARALGRSMQTQYSYNGGLALFSVEIKSMRYDLYLKVDLIECNL